MKRLLMFVCLLLIACVPIRSELKTLKLPINQSIALHNKNYPQVKFTLIYIVNRPAPRFNDFYLEYEYPVAGGIQKNQTLAECDSFPLEGILGPGDDHVRFELEFTCYPNYVEVRFPPGWTLAK